MASCQSTDANATATSFPNTPPTGDDVRGFAENSTILISMPLAVISLGPLSNDSTRIGLFPAHDGGDDCEVSADIRYSADARAWVFGIGTDVIGLTANSLVLVLSPRIKPFVGEGELACTDAQFLSDLAAGGRSTSAVLDRQEQLAR
jgi:hypothetical protein